MTVCVRADGVEVEPDFADHDDPWVTVHMIDASAEPEEGRFVDDANLLLTATEARLLGMELIVAADRAEQRIMQIEADAEAKSDWFASAGSGASTLAADAG
jgi:hypothetical protein